MSEHLHKWRRHVSWWLPPLFILLLALSLLAAYRLVFSDRALVQATRLERSRAELAEASAERAELEAFVGLAEENEQSIEEFYNERLATESQRLTEIYAEVKTLASNAGLAPSSISYTKEAIEEQGIVKRSIVFAVEGTYAELRRLINLMELSDSFLILEQVSLSESGDSAARLRINLRVASLFASGAAELAAAGGSR